MESSPSRDSGVQMSNDYFLARPLQSARDKLYCCFSVISGGVTTQVLLPNCEGLEFFFRSNGDEDAKVWSEDFEVETLRGAASIKARLRFALAMKRDGRLRFATCAAVPHGPATAKKAFAAVARRMRRSGAAIDGPVVSRFPELLRGWSSDPATVQPRLVQSAKAAIVLHLYYEETWPEIAELLQRLDLDFDLIVTVVSGKDGLAEGVAQAFPGAEVRIVENRGRDVRPFLQLLEEGRLDRYRYVCKIHGKKSLEGNRFAGLGAVWRHRMLFDLLGAPGAARAICEIFDAHPGVGMIGPRAYRYPSALCSLERSWGENRARVLDLAQRLGVADPFRLDFFCGTMFWVRPSSLRLLRSLSLSQGFEAESGALDGGLEHALERLFSKAVEASGETVLGISGESLEFTQAPL
ncbi:hypothetical protein GJ654_02375 [Rhodoblastus acidophilus]|jgi:hypothetical protein|uniref:Rhamnan synthesis protein F n=2 Tax=Rhodoblastus acidophilus TaxID=1074 RepID=A0A6N8DHV5_RHOAC|nr:rhamnan synthesis F family protein [Rhodoblastus acidophilus]MTV29837.1 hypothetical protein [Rhodoblastus acidophilus]